jgi:hypothetical protein
VSYDVDTSDLYRLLDSLGDLAEETVRPVAQAGAQVIYNEARRLVGRSSKPHYFYGTSYEPDGFRKGPNESVPGRYLFYPGTLKDAIYQVYSEDKSEPTIATYHISWNAQKAPYGGMVEYGLSPFTSESKPFLRPALINKQQEAVEAMTAVLVKKLGEL